MASYQEALQNETMADYFGIDRDSAWWMVVNTGASYAFDPITWVTPGARSSWAWTKMAMTNPAHTARYLKSPQFRSAIPRPSSV